MKRCVKRKDYIKDEDCNNCGECTKTKPEWEDYGESSLTLLAVLVGINKKIPSIPYDPSDFRRCVHLFECLDFDETEIRDSLTITANKYPQWKPFADNWLNLMKLYNEEKKDKKANKLYELLIKLRKEKVE